VSRITANALCFGPVESKMFANIPKGIVNTQKKSTSAENKVEPAREVAGMVTMLCGKERNWISAFV